METKCSCCGRMMGPRTPDKKYTVCKRCRKKYAHETGLIVRPEGGAK